MTITAAERETPVFFDAAGTDLFGIFTEPTSAPRNLAVLDLWGAGGLPTFGKNQVRRRLAHRLAEQGFPSLRIDYRGLGESGGEARHVDMAEPWVDDARGAARWLATRGYGRVAIVGMCFGGRTALAAAPDIAGLAGLALVSAPMGEGDHRAAILERPLSWYLKRATSPKSLRSLIGGPKARRRRRTLAARLRRLGPRPPSDRHRHSDAGPKLLDPLRSVLTAGTPVLLLYGRTDDFYPDFERARAGELGRVLDEAGTGQATVRIVDDHIDGLPSVRAQETFIATISEWVASIEAIEGRAP